MSRLLGILAAVLALLFLASPAVLDAAERTHSGIEVRNGTRTQNLARLTRTLLSQHGFHVVQIGNHIDFGAEATVIYYQAEAEKVARMLQSEIFPGARVEESSTLKTGVDIKVLLGSDLLGQPRMMARLLGEELETSPRAVNASTSESGPPPRPTAAQGTAAPAIVTAPAKTDPSWSPSQAQPAVPPAAWVARSGGIQHHTDSRGVLHIGNVAPRPSYNPSAVPEALTAPPEMTAPAVPWPSLAKIVETSAPEPHQDAIKKACQGLAGGAAPAHEFAPIIAAAGQAAGEKKTVEVTVDYNYLPVRQVYQEQGVMLALAPQPVATKTAEAAAAGGIRRYRDARGVWQISNAAPAAQQGAPAVQVAKSLNNPSGEARQLGRPAAAQPRLPVRQAAWSPEERYLATLPTTASPAAQAAPGSQGLVRQYRDSKGMIHISNADPEPLEALPPAGLMARNRTAAGMEPLARRPVPALADPEDGLDWRPAAWSDDGGPKPLKRTKAAQALIAEGSTDGGIRRYRDKKGTIHIKTVEYPLPPGVVLPPRQAGPSLMAPKAAAPTPPASISAPAVSNLPGSATSALPASPPTFSGAGAQITAFKDAKGRLRITTALPQPVPGQMPPPLPFHAELEPLILEAAQIHRLPPTLIKAVIKVESNFCSWAVSPKGAMGLMQLMPGTADFLGVREPFSPRDNILGGSRYLRMLIDLFGGNLPLALASYNAGFQRVIDCGYQIPAIKETQNFVTAVMARYVAQEKRGRQPWT